MRVHPLGAAETAEAELIDMVRAHYDNEPLMRLAGEIHFDTDLSRADVAAAVQVYGRPLPQVVYLPCCGTLRHAPAILKQGAGQVVAVDLSLPSLLAGLARNVPAEVRQHLSVHHGDIRDATPVLPRGGVELAFLGGNSLGDITAPAGHQAFVAALAGALAPGGVLVFDYVADRYLPPGGQETTEWSQMWHGPDGDIEVIDRRTRRVAPLDGSGMAVLHVDCEILQAATGRTVVAAHSYRKLIVPDALLIRQFAAAGLHLENVGPVADWSPYYRERIDRIDDLGMLGEPCCWYRAERCAGPRS
ncbi:class I SAM-dependent methyltransferase [Streptomyces sp. NBC_00341]|uniref:class I SAM-dependent methyltransferase n=1 Tax=unclassified Streptomyces TaxID=2593676 RepID=UPI00093E0A99|nr:class I SAM-dependent methyltransferase [Streptomyces sp. CB02488]WRZ15499.1 class I SAM-dependent methyltransferase [Streptomyces sp. NBC_00341]